MGKNRSQHCNKRKWAGKREGKTGNNRRWKNLSLLPAKYGFAQTAFLVPSQVTKPTDQPSPNYGK